MTLGHLGHQQNGHHTNNSTNGNGEDADMFSPLQPHAYPSFESANRVLRQPLTGTLGSTCMGDSNNHFAIGFDMSTISSSSNDISQSPSSQGLYDPSSSVPFYSDSSAPSNSTMGMFEPTSQGGFSSTQASYVSHNSQHQQQSNLTPI
ncbi:hypothetical protein BGZ94_006783, partial [Podila epigama]